jgi:hypothetical protein
MLDSYEMEVGVEINYSPFDSCAVMTCQYVFFSFSPCP